jgi:hypothetical protein
MNRLHPLAVEDAVPEVNHTPSTLDGDDDGRTATLSDAAARRLANQLARAFRGTYEANTGLRSVMRSVARQMLGTGSSRAAVTRALAGCVLNHPARLGADPRDSLTGDAHSRALVELARDCVADAARDVSPV